MRAHLTVCLTIAAMMGAADAQSQGQSYGAIAFNPVTDTLFAVTDEPTFEAAEKSAAKGCVMASAQPAACAVPLVFWDSCGALAKASAQIYGTGWAPTQKEAVGWAYKVCKDFGGKDCRLAVVICTPGGEGFIPPG